MNETKQSAVSHNENTERLILTYQLVRVKLEIFSVEVNLKKKARIP